MLSLVIARTFHIIGIKNYNYNTQRKTFVGLFNNFECQGFRVEGSNINSFSIQLSIDAFSIMVYSV